VQLMIGSQPMSAKLYNNTVYYFDFYMMTVIRIAAIRMIIFWNRAFLRVYCAWCH